MNVDNQFSMCSKMNMKIRSLYLTFILLKIDPRKMKIYLRGKELSLRCLSLLSEHTRSLMKRL